jgi:hypothetical protein
VRLGRLATLAAIVGGSLAVAVVGTVLATSNAEASEQVLVAHCEYLAFCWQTGPMPWDYTFSSSQLSLFDTGSVPLVQTQTNVYTVRLSETTLDIYTTDGTVVSTVPEYEGTPYIPGQKFPLPPVTVGTFDFQIPAGADITGASISGEFGNSFAPTTAAGNVCVGFGPCVPLAATPEPSGFVYFAAVLPGMVGFVRRRGRARP